MAAVTMRTRGGAADGVGLDGRTTAGPDAGGSCHRRTRASSAVVDSVFVPDRGDRRPYGGAREHRRLSSAICSRLPGRVIEEER
jgi:hypothetical protein